MRKFLFDTSFDPGAAAPAQKSASTRPPHAQAPAPAPTPVLSAADLEQARQEGQAAGYALGESAGHAAGFEAGRAAGHADAQTAAVHLTAEALSAIERSLTALLERHAEAQAAAERAALSIARAALARLFPATSQRHGLEEMEALLADCLARLGEEPRVVVRVADDLYDALDGKLAALTRSSGFEGKIVLLSEPDFVPGDLRVEWADGGAERSGADAAAAVDEILGRALAARAAPAPSVEAASAEPLEETPLADGPKAPLGETPEG